VRVAEVEVEQLVEVRVVVFKVVNVFA